MRPSTIKELIKLVEDSEIDELEVSSWGRKVRITRKQQFMNGTAPSVAPLGQVFVAEQTPAASQVVIPAQPAVATPEVADQGAQASGNLV